MKREQVMTNPKDLVRIELEKQGYDIKNIKIPRRVYLLADGIYDAMLRGGYGEYQYSLGGDLYAFKNNPQIGFVKGEMCSPGIATQIEDLVAGGVKEFVHIGLAGGINDNLEIGDVVVTEGAFNDTAVARLYGFDVDFLETSEQLTTELYKLMNDKGIRIHRGKHWTTDAGYHETWEQIQDYSLKGALCVEMECVGMLTIAKYRECLASAIYVITDVLDENGWHLGWNGNVIDSSIEKIVKIITENL